MQDLNKDLVLTDNHIRIHHGFTSRDECTDIKAAILRIKAMMEIDDTAGLDAVLTALNGTDFDVENASGIDMSMWLDTEGDVSFSLQIMMSESVSLRVFLESVINKYKLSSAKKDSMIAILDILSKLVGEVYDKSS